jgi:tetratricopeptide (TPR) repeat protein
MNYLPADKIRIFVSSRLEECADERAYASAAITSLNYDPVMFEAAGARPYPPRSIYLKGIDNSHIFVGIYKEGYGYIAEGMDISGLEDEYEYSKNLGRPQLLYVKKDCRRDETLEKLISDFTGLVTIVYYDKPSDLYDVLRQDIVSLVTDYFLRGQRTSALSPPQPSSIIDELVPLRRRISRPAVETKLLSQLDSVPLVLVTGPLGAGKTIFLATLASQQQWIFVQCGERTPREILMDTANGARVKLGLDQLVYAQMEEARIALKASWQAMGSVTLVLDDVRTDEVADAVIKVIEAFGKRRIVLSARDSKHLPGIATFSLPPLQRDEIIDFVARNRSKAMIPGELEELTRLSGGNPLYLRYYTSVEPGKYENTLEGFELKAWHDLAPRTREALSYIALTNRSLQLEELMDLMSSSAEEISTIINGASNLINDISRGYSIFHPHAKITFIDAISDSPQLFKFYAQRLAKCYLSRRDYTTAFAVLDNAGMKIPRRLMELAGQHAAIQGNMKVAISIIECQLRIAREQRDARKIRDLLIYLADAQSHAGKTDEALRTVEDAKKIHVQGDAFIPVREVELSILAWARSDPNAISGLADVKQQYIEKGSIWDAARIALGISAYLIRKGDYRQALDEAEYALTVFEEHKDSYGVKLAKLNLLSASSGLPDKSEMTNTLMAELKSASEISSRQRAALLNVLGRVAREKNDIKGAKAFAEEAIGIGRDLGDADVVCTNLMNLGNAFRQEGNLDAALDKYEAADKVARESRLLQSEAWAQELIASIFNAKSDGQRALHHARYAISLVKDGVSIRTEKEAYEEMARAYEIINDKESACEAWLKNAELEYAYKEESESGIWAFLRAARLFYKDHSQKKYIDAYRRIYSIKQSDTSLSNFEILADEFPRYIVCVPVQYVFEASVYHARLTYNGLPRVLVRQVYLRLMAQMLSQPKENQNDLKQLRAAMAITMALPRDTVSIGDVVEIGERLARYNPNLSFRAQADGASHWAISAQFAKPVIVTISQIDNRPDVSLVTLCLALVLLSFPVEISEDVLGGITPLRNEANVQVINYDEARELLPLEQAGLHSMEDACSVTRATDPKSDDGTPIIVITRDDITSEWLVGEGRGNSGQLLFAKFLVELVYHLFAGEIELENLYPKIMLLVKKTIV